ncbi:MAG TPA: hypothetical protein VMT35_13250, partial [Ignavibacteriaceae bacterium]|nr:hypothetical protein [Ignavibacteriaceae bacterium]
LRELLKDYETFLVYGGIPKDDDENAEFNREKNIKSFKESPGPCILIANPAACAESISLHKACKQAIYLDRTFNCGLYLQSLDRIHRIGLNKDDVIIYHIIEAENTIDETINRRLIEKEKNMLKILDDDLPVGSYEFEESILSQSEQDEEADYNETLKDIKRQFRSNL